MAFKVHTFATPNEVEFFLNGGVVGGKSVVGIGGKVLGLHGTTLVFNSPAGTVTFSDATGAGLTYQQVKAAIEAVHATVTVSFDHGRIRLVDSGGAVSLDKTGTANTIFGFSTGSDTVGVAYAAPGGAAPALVTVDADTVNNTWTVLVAAS